MKYLALFVGLLVSGCASFESKVFDPVEYDYTVRTTVEATRAIHLCGDDARQEKFNDFLKQLNTTTMYLYEYENHHAANSDTMVATTVLRDLVVGIATNFTDYTPGYCVHKLSEVQSVSRTMSRAIGGQSSLDICGSDVSVRYSQYEASYKAKLITKGEFDELVNDLVRLAEADVSACSVQQKIELKRAIELISSAAKLL